MRHSVRNETALFIGHLLQLSLGIQIGTIGVGWPYIEKTFGLGFESLGILVGTGMVARLFSSFASGRLIARFGLRKFILGGVLLFGVGSLGYGLAPSWALLLLSAVIAGLGDSAFGSGISTYVVSNYSARRLNWLQGIFGIGLMIGPQLVTWLVRDLGQPWQLMYLLVGAVICILGLLLLPLSSGWQIVPHHVEGQAPLRPASPMQTMKMPLLWLCLAVYFVYGGAEVGTGQFVNALYTKGRGLDPRVVSTWVTLFWLGFTVGRLVLGSLVDRIGKTRLIRLCTFGIVFGSLMIWLYRDPTYSYLGLLLTGLALGPIFPTLTTQSGDRFGLAHMANAVGFQMGAGALGAGILPAISGWVATLFSIEAIPITLVVQSFVLVALHEYTIRYDAQSRQRVQTVAIGIAANPRQD
jgi:fucose permease